MGSRGYRNAFFLALGLHLFLAIFLFSTPSTTLPVPTLEAKNEANHQSIAKEEQQEQVIKAVSVDNQEVAEMVHQLKEKKQAEAKKQRELLDQVKEARKERLAEQKRLAKLKEEATKLAIAKKKQLAEEKERLKKLADKQEAERKRLAALKKQQEELKKKQEAERLAELKQKKAEEARKKEAQKRAQAEREKAELARKREQAAEDAARRKRIAGEVDKYKALIVNAISRQWILPENANKQQASKFRIRLAPNGVVLEVSLIQSSGDALLDRSAQTAIYKASPLPVPSDPEAFDVFRDISLTVRPENVRG